MIKSNLIHSRLTLPKDSSGNYIYGKNDLFAIVIILKLMLSKTSFGKFYYSVKHEIAKLEKQLTTITIDDVLHEMGFPKNWGQIKNI